MRHMHADLMRTTGFQTQTQAGMDAEMFHNAVVGHRRFAHRMHRHMGTLGRVTADRLFHCATGGHMTDRHRFVFTGDLALQRLHQRVCAGMVSPPPSDRWCLYRTMNNTRARHIGNRRIVVQQRIQHSTVRVARAGCTTRSRGLLITMMSSSS